MTIQFNCPNCSAVIAFDSKHAGKRAKCFTCGQRFIIPLRDGERPKKVKEVEEKGEAVPGFYRAALVDNWKIFTTPANVTPLVFVAAAVCAKFLVANRNYTLTIPGRAYIVDLPLPIGHVLHASAWGFLFWYYMETIYTTAFERETLPEVIVGGFNGLVGLIARSVYLCIVMLLVVALPLIVYVVIAEIADVGWPVLFYVLIFVGVFLLPMAIVTLAVGKDLTMLRPDYILGTIFGAFRPYLVTTLLVGIACAIQTQADQYAHQGVAAAAGDLLLNLAAQVFALAAVRSVGLFYRHYGCLFPW